MAYLVAQGMCLTTANVVLPSGGANSAPQNSLAGFGEPFQGVEKRGERKEGRGKKEEKGREKGEKTPAQ